MSDSRRPIPAGRLDRLLSPFADVRDGEARGALLLALNAFLLLAAYYVIKPVREALILTGGGAEVKSYSSAGQALLLLFLIPAYGRFASRVSRVGLITWVTLFFISNLIVFYALGVAKTPLLGVAFFLWVGIFNVMIIAQFWGFANDVYTPEQGKRLFAIVAVGSNTGAILGAWVAKPLIAAAGVYVPLLIAAAMLGACIALSRRVHAVVAVCESIKRGLVAGGVPAAKIEVVYSGTDLERFHPGVDGAPIRRELGLDREDVLVTQIGVRSWRGWKELMAAMRTVAARRSRARLLFVGAPPPRAVEIADHARAAGLGDRVMALGHRDDIWSNDAVFRAHVTGGIRWALGIEN